MKNRIRNGSRPRASLANRAGVAMLLGSLWTAGAVCAAEPGDLFEGFGKLPAPEPAPEKKTDAVDTSPARSRMYEGMVDIQDKKYEEGIPKLEWAIREDPSLLGAWESLGWAYWLTGRQADTRTLWERLLSLAPNEPIGYNLMAQLLTREGHLDKAAEYYRQSLKLEPNQYETRFSLARVVLWSGERAEATRMLRDLFREDADRVDVEIELAWALYANEEYEDAVARWNHVCEMIPDFPDYMSARAEALLYSGALDEAQAEARRILELEPNHLKALNLLAAIAEREGRPEDAIETLRQIQNMAQDDVVRAMIARRIAALMGAYHDREPNRFPMSQVLKAAREAMDLDPQDIQGTLYYGELLVKDKQFDKAETLFNDFLKNRNPHNVRARMGLLETYFGRNQLDLAETQLRSNLKDMDPDDPFRHVYWARLHYARGQYFDALEDLDRLEEEGAKGSVFTLLYHGLSPSEFTDMLSVRQFRDQILALSRAGFRFITPNEFPDYFKSLPEVRRFPGDPLLHRMVGGVRRAWTGEPAPAEDLRAIVPDRVACITFDDGLRTSFRNATPVGEDLGLRMAMHVAVGLVLSNDVYISSFPEIREFMKTGVWEIGSHLVDASTRQPVDAEGAAVIQKAQSYGLPPSRSVTPMPNRIWNRDANRLETLREYSTRVRREFRFSRETLLRELGLGSNDIRFLAYVEGDIGQESSCNVETFPVMESLLNEAAITYRAGFIQSTYGYAMQTDNPMLYQRYEPKRIESGREVMLQAFRANPIFLARRMRAEMAALQGQLYLALEMLDLLKRDGYPDELMQEISDYVHRRLARQISTPKGVNEDDETIKPRAIEPHAPYVGVEASSTKANILLDEQRVLARAGLNLNRRVSLEGRVGRNRIHQQTVSNIYYEVDQDKVTHSREIVTTTDGTGTTTYSDQRTTTVETQTLSTNRTERRSYDADETMWGIQLNRIGASGALLILDGWQRSFGENLDGDSVLGYAAEYQWRPYLGLDMAARFQHDAVPSARAIMEYDSGALNAVWRVRDWWHFQTQGNYALYSDDNSMLALNAENLWQISARHDVWLGLHHSVATTDRASDLYWTPYWDQRHYLVTRIRRSYPNYFGSLQLHLGVQKEKARADARAKYEQLRIQGEKLGFYPGDNPDQDWSAFLGASAAVNRKWSNGLEASLDFTVNALRDYTERSVTGSLLYRF